MNRYRLSLAVASTALLAAVFFLGYSSARVEPESPQHRADRFAAALLARWNAAVAAHGFPADRARCRPHGASDGEAVFDCVWRVRDVRDGRVLCRAATLGSSFVQFSAGWVRCAGRFALRPQAE